MGQIFARDARQIGHPEALTLIDAKPGRLPLNMTHRFFDNARDVSMSISWRHYITGPSSLTPPTDFGRFFNVFLLRISLGFLLVVLGLGYQFDQKAILRLNAFHARYFFQGFSRSFERQADRQLADCLPGSFSSLSATKSTNSVSLLTLGSQVLETVRRRSSSAEAEAYLVTSESRSEDWSEGLPENAAVSKSQGIGSARD